MNRAIIIIDNYSKSQSRRQPWYSVKSLKLDLERAGYSVEIVDNFHSVEKELGSLVIVAFSLKHLFRRTKEIATFTWLMTFPLYNPSKIFKTRLSVWWENRRDLARIGVGILLFSVILQRLRSAQNVIVLSDRQDELLRGRVDFIKYYPFIRSNWPKLKEKAVVSSKELTLGYFGPPFSTRYYPELLEFFDKTTKKSDCNARVITRTERLELSRLHSKFYSPYVENKKIEIVEGFLSREELLFELSKIDILFMPFHIVMSELPIVVLEAIELSIPVVTNKECGLHLIAKDYNGVYFIENGLDEGLVYLNQIWTEERTISDCDIFMQNLVEYNKHTLRLICQK